MEKEKYDTVTFALLMCNLWLMVAVLIADNLKNSFFPVFMSIIYFIIHILIKIDS